MWRYFDAADLAAWGVDAEEPLMLKPVAMPMDLPVVWGSKTVDMWRSSWFRRVEMEWR